MKKKKASIVLFSFFQLTIIAETSVQKKNFEKYIKNENKIEKNKKGEKFKKNEAKKKSVRTISLNNNITIEALTYTKHWYKPFPSNFEVFVNDQAYISLQNGKPKFHEKIITLMENTLKITYEWTLKKFGKIWHTEKQEMKFKIPQNKEELIMQFCWEKENRIILDDAKMITCANLDTTKKPT